MLAEEPGHEFLMTELGRMNSELEAQRRLCAEVVHDLSNPVQVVLGLAELLVEHPTLDPVVRQRVSQLHRSAQTMSALVGDLAQGYSLGDHDRLSRERIELADLVTSVVDRSRLLAETKRIGILLDVHVAGECWIDADPSKIERALSNLVGNAVKFSPEGSSVTVSLTWDLRQAHVGVEDEGPGISREGQARVFEVFHREPTTAHLPGLGLGLFITRQIAEGHGGDVEVESQPGRGARFVLSLPLAPRDALAARRR
jgi:signal transduction histidine kinase